MIYDVCICSTDNNMMKLNKMYVDNFSKDTQFEINCKCFWSGYKMTQYAKKNCIDIVILETNLGEQSGIDIAKCLKQIYPEIIIIFISDCINYALEAINELDALSFLTKPILQSRLNHILKRAIILTNAVKEEYLLEQIVITENNIKKKVIQQNIIYIEKKGAQCIINTYKNQYRVYETVSSILERLSDYFIRINQSIIVNIKEIISIKSDTVLLKNGVILYIGRTYRNDVRKRWISTV